MRFAFNVVFYGLVEFIHWPARDRKLYLLARWMLMGLSFSSFAPNEPALLFEWFLICTKRTRKQSLQLIMSCGVVVVRETGAIACLLLFRLNWIFLGFFFFLLSKSNRILISFSSSLCLHSNFASFDYDGDSFHEKRMNNFSLVISIFVHISIHTLRMNVFMQTKK